MAKTNKPDVNDILLKGHKRGIKKAIDIASRTNTSLIVQKNDHFVHFNKMIESCYQTKTHSKLYQLNLKHIEIIIDYSKGYGRRKEQFVSFPKLRCRPKSPC